IWIEEQSKDTNRQKRNKTSWRNKDGQAPSKVPVCQAPKERTKSAKKWRNPRIAELLREAKIDRPKLPTWRMLNAKVKGRWNRPKGGSPSASEIPTYFAE
ncbi:hypothetical protein MTR67_026059, partial [Solanum verrucosum]